MIHQGDPLKGTGGHKPVTVACRALALAIAVEQRTARQSLALHWIHPPLRPPDLVAARNLNDLDLNGRRAAWPQHEARRAYPTHTQAMMVP